MRVLPLQQARPERQRREERPEQPLEKGPRLQEVLPAQRVPSEPL